MDLIAKHYLNQNITTRFIRVMPLTWSYEANIRIELYGCPGTILCIVQNVGGIVKNVGARYDPEDTRKEVQLFTIVPPFLGLSGYAGCLNVAVRLFSRSNIECSM